MWNFGGKPHTGLLLDNSSVNGTYAHNDGQGCLPSGNRLVQWLNISNLNQYLVYTRNFLRSFLQLQNNYAVTQALSSIIFAGNLDIWSINFAPNSNTR